MRGSVKGGTKGTPIPMDFWSFLTNLANHVNSFLLKPFPLPNATNVFPLATEPPRGMCPRPIFLACAVNSWWEPTTHWGTGSYHDYHIIYEYILVIVVIRILIIFIFMTFPQAYISFFRSVDSFGIHFPPPLEGRDPYHPIPSNPLPARPLPYTLPRRCLPRPPGP